MNDNWKKKSFRSEQAKTLNLVNKSNRLKNWLYQLQIYYKQRFYLKSKRHIFASNRNERKWKKKDLSPFFVSPHLLSFLFLSSSFQFSREPCLDTTEDVAKLD